MPTSKATKNSVNPHHGSDFNSFLEEEGIRDEVEIVAIKRLVALKLHRMMQRVGQTKAGMAQKMSTSRAAVDRVLNPRNTAITLATLNRAAKAVGGRIKIEIVSDRSVHRVEPKDLAASRKRR